MKLIVACDSNYKITNRLLDFFEKNKNNIEEIVCGDEISFNTISKKYNIPIKKFVTEWQRFGKRAGILKNKKMIKYADAILYLNHSKNANAIIKEAKSKNLTIFNETGF